MAYTQHGAFNKGKEIMKDEVKAAQAPQRSATDVREAKKSV